ncbi:MAG TPA: phosphatidylserine decarboxylase family protein [Nitrospirales bacterium]|nr:phosphatidylserine decarboxylase family protein [Nitrospirales bacterium]
MADRAKGWPVAPEGLPFVAAAAVAGAGTLALGWTIPGAVLSAGALFAAWFFRNPSRRVPDDPKAIVSPGDGRVLAVVEENEDRFLKARAVRISIFLSPLNVHINRTPCAGRVAAIGHVPGKFLVASRQGATLENEQTAVLIETESGARVLCVQVAGYVARRIVCWLTEGERVARGERYGLIRFGSRMDLYLPLGTDMRVSVGDRVKGGESVIGVFA